mmetsp:Transcript_48430/g.134244  ORF Transcript_48430/g.134244 Transcript_48430/m.134244 type:complete len:149 (-) Transcript_48430:205-651(-)|eukprot:6816303-Prymnesium_polylepis.1
MADAAALAGHLFRDAQEAAGRLEALAGHLDAEEAAAADLLAECEALRREGAQYRGWIANADAAAGEAYRLSKALHEESDRRMVLEHEVFLLKSKLRAISSSLNSLTQRQQAQAADNSAIADSADDVLRQLESLRGGGRGAAQGEEPPG